MNEQGLLMMWNTKWTWRTKWFRRTLKMPVTSWMTVTTRWTLRSKLNSNAKTRWFKNYNTALCPRLKVWTPGSNKKSWQGLSKKLIWGQRCPVSRTQSDTNWTDLNNKTLRSLISCQKWSRWKLIRDSNLIETLKCWSRIYLKMSWMKFLRLKINKSRLSTKSSKMWRILPKNLPKEHISYLDILTRKSPKLADVPQSKWKTWRYFVQSWLSNLKSI